ncbi:hypothetical protein AAZX31_15G245800 [Glycine max]
MSLSHFTPLCCTSSTSDYEARTLQLLAVSGVRHDTDTHVRVEFDVFDRCLRVRVVSGVHVTGYIFQTMKHGHSSSLPCPVSDTTPTPMSGLSLMCLTGVYVSVSCPVSVSVSVLHIRAIQMGGEHI